LYFYQLLKQLIFSPLPGSGEASQKLLIMLRAAKARGFLGGSGGMPEN
jgi:hypothetical protein